MTEPQSAALPQSAEDRKAASALASLDAPQEASTPPPSKNVNQAAVNAALSSLSGEGVVQKNAETPAPRPAAATTARKAVKINPDHVAFLVRETELGKAKVTEMLKAADGDLDEALTAFVAPSF